ncbi:MAG: M24 family metallopeptidase, partial [Chloroflexi bacterium]|nr:M24 family metallopeptidase [Chloroflexota bacterium]
MAIVLKSPHEIALMRKAGSAVARGLEYLRNAVRPGMSTAELDELAAKFLQREGMEPSFKGYQGFPACLCVSVDDEVVHGIPRPDRVLREGNIVGLDFGAIYEGFHADAAVTVPVGKVSAEAIKMV